MIETRGRSDVRALIRERINEQTLHIEREIIQSSLAFRCFFCLDGIAIFFMTDSAWLANSILLVAVSTLWALKSKKSQQRLIKSHSVASRVLYDIRKQTSEKISEANNDEDFVDTLILTENVTFLSSLGQHIIEPMLWAGSVVSVHTVFVITRESEIVSRLLFH